MALTNSPARYCLSALVSLSGPSFTASVSPYSRSLIIRTLPEERSTTMRSGRRQYCQMLNATLANSSKTSSVPGHAQDGSDIGRVTVEGLKRRLRDGRFAFINNLTRFERACFAGGHVDTRRNFYGLSVIHIVPSTSGFS